MQYKGASVSTTRLVLDCFHLICFQKSQVTQIITNISISIYIYTHVWSQPFLLRPARNSVTVPPCRGPAFEQMPWPLTWIGNVYGKARCATGGCLLLRWKQVHTLHYWLVASNICYFP